METAIICSNCDHLKLYVGDKLVAEIEKGHDVVGTIRQKRQDTLFRKAAAECENCLNNNLPIPAYEQAIEASHIFNLLNARGVISVAERQAYIGRVRDLAKGSCAAWMEKNGWAA